MPETCDTRHNWASQTMAGRAAIAASCWARRPWKRSAVQIRFDDHLDSLGIWRSSGPDYPESAAEAPCHRTSILSVKRPVYSQSWSMAGFADLFRSTSFVMQAPRISWRLIWDDWGIAYIGSTTWFLSNLLKNLRLWFQLDPVPSVQLPPPRSSTGPPSSFLESAHSAAWRRQDFGLDWSHCDMLDVAMT